MGSMMDVVEKERVLSQPAYQSNTTSRPGLKAVHVATECEHNTLPEPFVGLDIFLHGRIVFF